MSLPNPQAAPMDEEHARIFQRTMHEDSIFNERLNFFLLFESFIIAAFATLSAARPRAHASVLVVMAAFGIAVTIIWLYAQHRQLMLLRAIISDLETFANDVVRARIRARGEQDRLPRIGSVLAYAVPLCLIFLWIGAILAAIVGLL